MNNENNHEPQLTPVPENNEQKVNNPQPQVQDNANTIKSIDPALNDKAKTESGARIETNNVEKPKIQTAAFETEHKKIDKKTGTHDGPSKGVSFALIVFFILLIAFVFFLPNISEYMRVWKENANMTEITSGKLICTYSRTSDKLNFDYTQTFEFTDKALYKLTYKEDVSGSEDDTKEIVKLYNDCNNIEKVSITLKGITVSCNYLNTKLTKTEVFSYNEIGDDNSDIKTAYVEGGGNYPEFKFKENIDDIEVSVKQAGYTCEKIK